MIRLCSGLSVRMHTDGGDKYSPTVSGVIARSCASAACRTCSLVSSNELRITVPPKQRKATITLSVVILRISRNTAALPAAVYCSGL